MSQPLLIPLAGIPEKFFITLVGVTYQFTVQWRNDPGGDPGWFLDIGDVNGNPILGGLPLITGADLLEQHQAELDMGGQLIVQTAQDALAVPTYDNLGTDCNLYFLPAS